jgi:pSer/pThr/pTyr-binding forkhead associated (FHA) protein
MDLTIAGVVSGDQIVKASSWSAPEGEGAPTYPVLVAVSDFVRPSRITLVSGVPIHIGRDPSSELWVGAPHVSRRHAIIQFDTNGEVKVTNISSNGLGYGEGVLQADESLTLRDQPMVFDFGGGLTVALCFTAEEETRYRDGSLVQVSSRNSRHEREVEGRFLNGKVANSQFRNAPRSFDEEPPEEIRVGNRRRIAGERSERVRRVGIGDSRSRTSDGETVVAKLKGFFGKLSSGR